MPYEVKDQRVIAVYFDKDRRVKRLANYGLRDGKVFDFISQTTPTGGQEVNYLTRRVDKHRAQVLTQCVRQRKKGPHHCGPFSF